VYTWGIFSRIYVADLRRDSVFVYFGKRGVTEIHVHSYENEATVGYNSDGGFFGSLEGTKL